MNARPLQPLLTSGVLWSVVVFAATAGCKSTVCEPVGCPQSSVQGTFVPVPLPKGTYRISVIADEETVSCIVPITEESGTIGTARCEGDRDESGLPTLSWEVDVAGSFYVDSTRYRSTMVVVVERDGIEVTRATPSLTSSTFELCSGAECKFARGTLSLDLGVATTAHQ